MKPYLTLVHICEGARSEYLALQRRRGDQPTSKEKRTGWEPDPEWGAASTAADEASRAQRKRREHRGYDSRAAALKANREYSDSLQKGTLAHRKVLRDNPGESTRIRRKR
jgi:primosomal protein N''